MSDNSSSGGSDLGCLAPFVGVAGLIATFIMGPIDLGSSVYNQIVGDTPVVKRELLDYSRRDIQRKNPDSSPTAIERMLADEVNYRVPIADGETVNPLDVSMEDLWDASEDHARSGYQRWIWPSLNEH